MHTLKTRETAERRAPRTPMAPSPKMARVAPAQTDEVWPGMTRAELREMVIEQIG